MKNEMYDSMYQTELFHWWFHAKREIVLSLAAPYLSQIQKPHIIDFGCGCGAMLMELENYGEVTGADFSERALNYCKTRFDGKLVQTDLSVPVQPQERYDFGVALDILEHIERDDIAAYNIFSFLKVGGKCIITVPAYQWLWSNHDDNCMHKRRYDKNRLRNLLEAAGFRIEYISYYNFYLFPPAAAVRLLSKVVPFDKSSSTENHVKDSLANRILYDIFVSEKRRICSGGGFPFGLSLIALADRP